MANLTNEDNWAARERLRTIERALWWRGWVGRKDLTELFGVSVAQASGDLQKYLEMNPGSMNYHTSRKRYEATPGSNWVLAEPNFEEGLAVFLGGAGTRIFPGQVGAGAKVAGVGLPARPGKPAAARALMLAVLGNLAVEMEYLSVNSGTVAWRTILPHAFGHDGYRWHVRAWCENNRDYRDFAISRINEVKWPVPHRPRDRDERPPDLDWEEIETIRLRPHRTLDEGRRRAIELDYGIESGGTLAIPVRKAMRHYLAGHLRIFEESEVRHFEAVEAEET